MRSEILAIQDLKEFSFLYLLARSMIFKEPQRGWRVRIVLYICAVSLEDTNFLSSLLETKEKVQESVQLRGTGNISEHPVQYCVYCIPT